MDGERHVPVDDLAIWSLGGLPAYRRQEIASHLATGCDQCLSDFVWFQKTLQIARSDRLQAPPPAVLHGALRIFREQRQPAGETLAGPPRLVGRVLFDSRNASRLAGARGAAQWGRQVLYAVEPLNLQIDLRVERDAPCMHLAGQILHATAPAAPAIPERIAVESLGGDSEVSILATGEFTATLADNGPHTLVVRIANQEIALPIPEGLDDDPAAAAH